MERFRYRHLAEQIDRLTASPWFLIAFLLLCLVGLSYSVDDTNITISIVTAAAVFMSVGANRRNAQAIQGKLDELIRCSPKARNEMLRAEDREEHEIEGLRS